MYIYSRKSNKGKMFRRFCKPKFYVKCESSVTSGKMRVEIARKKKNAVVKYMKIDIADLLRSRRDYDAFCRTEEIVYEEKRLSSYDFIETYFDNISTHLILLHKQRDCPEECREAVSSIIYAAARVTEIPELRFLRSLFIGKYGTYLDITNLEKFVKMEFAETFKKKRPSNETKLRIMHDIANQNSIKWNSKLLEKNQFKPPQYEQNELKHEVLNQSEDSVEEYTSSKKRVDGYYVSQDRNISIDEETKVDRKDSTSSDEAENKKSFSNKFFPPPYIKPKTQPKNGIDRVKSKSCRKDDSLEEMMQRLKSFRRWILKQPDENVDGNDEGIKGSKNGTDLRSKNHVHPNLPDYDDLPARIAALRER